MKHWFNASVILLLQDIVIHLTRPLTLALAYPSLMVMFLSSSFLNLTVWTPEIAFTTVDFPWATWPIVPDGEEIKKHFLLFMFNIKNLIRVCLNSIPILMVACLLMISGESGVKEVTSCRRNRSSKTLTSNSFSAYAQQYVPALIVKVENKQKTSSQKRTTASSRSGFSANSNTLLLLCSRSNNANYQGTTYNIKPGEKKQSH